MVGRKPEDWRWLTPIFSVASPILVGGCLWFLGRPWVEITERTERTSQLVERTAQMAQEQTVLNEGRYYRLQTEITALSGRVVRVEDKIGL